MKWVALFGLSALLLTAGTAGAAALIDGGDVVNGSLTGKDVRNSSLTGRDVKNKSLTRRDFRGSVRGPRGFTGPQGIQGPPGPTIVNRIGTYGAAMSVGPGGIDILTVACPPGHAVVSGGWTIIGGDTVPFVDKTYDDVSWSVGIDNFNSSISADAEVYAHCAPAGQAVAAGASRRASLIAADEDRQRASHQR
jgi:hypothetical protein